MVKKVVEIEYCIVIDKIHIFSKNSLDSSSAILLLQWTWWIKFFFRLERSVFGNASDVIQKLLGKEALEFTNRKESSSIAEKIDDTDSHSYFYSSDSVDHEENLDCDISDCQKEEGRAWVDDDCNEYLYVFFNSYQFDLKIWLINFFDI